MARGCADTKAVKCREESPQPRRLRDHEALYCWLIRAIWPPHTRRYPQARAHRARLAFTTFPPCYVSFRSRSFWTYGLTLWSSSEPSIQMPSTIGEDLSVDRRSRCDLVLSVPRSSRRVNSRFSACTSHPHNTDIPLAYHHYHLRCLSDPIHTITSPTTIPITIPAFRGNFQIIVNRNIIIMYRQSLITLILSILL
jgi:hypothetical protein